MYTTAAAWVMLTINRKATNVLEIDQLIENGRERLLVT
jgi:hypothetical protein